MRSSPRLLTHGGWQALEGGPASPPPAAWREVVERRARLVREAEGGAVCLQTHGYEVQLWPGGAREPAAQLQLGERATLVAVAGGCLASSVGAGHQLTTEVARRLAIEGEATAIGRAGRRPLAATATHLYLFGADGRRISRRSIDKGAVALAGVGRSLAVGYRDGKIELLGDDADAPTRSPAFERMPASPPAELLGGPMGTLIVGYRNGDVGIWNLSDGARLASARLRGPVAHLLLERHELFAASELGDHLVWDLGQLGREYCALMREVWRRVPVVWEDGRAVARAPSERHRCPCRHDGAAPPRLQGQRGLGRLGSVYW